jgi:hypothetical protein
MHFKVMDIGSSKLVTKNKADQQQFVVTRALPPAEVMGNLPGGALGGKGHCEQWRNRVCGLGSKPKQLISCRRIEFG